MKNTCPRPFESFVLWENGASPCCHMYERAEFSFDKKTTLESLWNSKLFQEMRQSMIDGSYKFCHESCPILQNLPSVETLSPEIQKDFEEQKTELPLERIRILLKNFDKTCNLSCPSCRKENLKGENQKVLSELLEELRYQGSQIRLVYMTGAGDSLASEFHCQWLKKFKNQEYPSLEEVQIATNAQLLTPEFWKELSPDLKSKKITLLISIDAAKEDTYERIRRGGSYLRLVENMNFVSLLKQQKKINCLLINFVIQKDNFKEIPSFVKRARLWNADNILFNDIQNWNSAEEGYFEAQSVWRKEHELHHEYLKVISQPYLKPYHYQGFHGQIWGQGT